MTCGWKYKAIHLPDGEVICRVPQLHKGGDLYVRYNNADYLIIRRSDGKLILGSKLREYKRVVINE